MQQPSAGLVWKQEGAYPCLVATGAWTLHQRKPDLDALWAQGDFSSGELGLSIEVNEWDSSLLVLIRQIQRHAKQQNCRLHTQGITEGMQRLLDMAATPSTQVQEAQPVQYGWVSRIGLQAYAVLDVIEKSATFTGEVVLGFVRLVSRRARMRSSDFWNAFQQCGPGALPIVALISILVGLILAFVGAVQLAAFGAQIYIANMVAIGMTREMGALMTAVIMAGRTGAAYAAELGSMQANEEVDALKTFGFPPMEFLVLPRVLALLISMPILTCFADALGILGGFTIGYAMYDISAAQYWEQTLSMLASKDVLIGVFKSLVFALLIAMIGCYYGLNCARNAQAVGQATTRAVVSIIVALVVCDATITVICTQLGI